MAACSRTGLDAAGPRAPSADGGDASACPPATFGDLTDDTKWSRFDVAGVDEAAKGFQGAAFDGRYVYLVPFFDGEAGGAEGHSGTVARYDTLAPLASIQGWRTFDVSSMNAAARGFQTASFDGRFVYLVPFFGGDAPTSVLARYDVTSDFEASTAWTTFDLATVSPRASGFCGAAFDGRYLYLVPLNDGSWDGVVVRHDTLAPLDSAWDTLNLSLLGHVDGFAGTAFDGRYLYLAPYGGGRVARLDTHGAFADPGSWTAFDVSPLHAENFAGATYDGRYVYFVPHDNGDVARYDTASTFESPSSWDVFHLAKSTNAGARGFSGAAFDGRFVYLAPLDGIVARYDTLAPFGEPGSWETRDLGTHGYFGALLTAASCTSSRATTARAFTPRSSQAASSRASTPVSPPCLPPRWNASFF